MADISDILYQNLPLYKTSYDGSYKGLNSANLMLPNKLKLLVHPNKIQPISSGMYFVVPFEPLLSELEELDSVLAKHISVYGSTAANQPLEVSKSLLDRMLGAPAPPKIFNSFRVKRSKLYVTGTKCLFVNPFEQTRPTDIYSPRYGESYSMESIAKLSMSIVAILTACANSIEGDLNDRIKHDINLINKLSDDYGPILQESLFGLMFQFDCLRFYDSTDIFALSGLFDLLLSFYDPFTDVTDYLFWSKK